MNLMNPVDLDELVERGRERYPKRNHHPRCPTRPGEPLAAGTMCADCVYGAIADREDCER